MRISEKKINRITRQIVETLSKDKNVKLQTDLNTLEAEIKFVILEDLKEEDAIEEEAKKILEKHSNIIARENVDFQTLLNKAKTQIARQRGFVL